MVTTTATANAEETVPTLKDPMLAAFLAWLVPGAGHLYQGRTAKGVLFMTCILSTFFYGLVLGDFRVVYASWRPDDHRLPYLCQIGAGLPALPAMVQAYRVRNGQAPLFPDAEGNMAPPTLGGVGQLSEWNKEHPHEFELGTVYTMIAGLLNVLVIYDAWGGPMLLSTEEERKRKKKPSSPPEPVAGGG